MPAHPRPVALVLAAAALVFVIALATVTALATPAGAQAPDAPTFTGYVPRTGTSIVVLDRSAAPDELAPALAGSGCVLQAFAITQLGAHLVYVVGAPAFVNEAFPTFLSPGTPLSIRCTPAPATVTETVVTRFVPERPAASTARDGSCFTNSLALGGRADAWRCMVGNEIHDPCFELADGAVVCGASPVGGESGFLLTLTEPLPPPALTDAAIEQARRNAWLVELADGAICEINTGATGGINDLRANYGCPDGQWIFGDLMTGTPWTAMLGTLTVSEDGYRLGRAREAVLRRAWQ